MLTGRGQSGLVSWVVRRPFPGGFKRWLLAELDRNPAARRATGDKPPRTCLCLPRVAAALRTCGVRCEGVNLFLADGEAAGQEVFHAHLHVFPRYAGDGFGFKFSPNYFVLPPRAELDDIARGIRNALQPLPGIPEGINR
jgi:hypothetical protein